MSVFTTEASEQLQDGGLPTDVIIALLNLHVSPSHNWARAIQRLHVRYKKQFGKKRAVDELRRSVAFTILLPTNDQYLTVDHDDPESNLFRWSTFRQRDDEDWFVKLQDLVSENVRIVENRERVRQLGLIIRPELQPMSRQALAWVLREAKNAGDFTESSQLKHHDFVCTYGGASVCTLFQQYKPAISKVPNWRTAYFVERLLHKRLGIERLIELKRKELKKTDQNNIREIEPKESDK